MSDHYGYESLTEEGQRKRYPDEYAAKHGIAALVAGLREDAVVSGGRRSPMLVLASLVKRKDMEAAWAEEMRRRPGIAAEEDREHARALLSEARHDLAMIEDDIARAKRKGMRSSFDGLTGGIKRRVRDLERRAGVEEASTWPQIPESEHAAYLHDLGIPRGPR